MSIFKKSPQKNSFNDRRYPRIPIGITCRIIDQQDQSIRCKIFDFNNALHLFCPMDMNQIANFSKNDKVHLDLKPNHLSSMLDNEIQPILAKVYHIRENQQDQQQPGIIFSIKKSDDIKPLLFVMSNYYNMLNKFTELFPDIFYIHDLDGNLLFVSKGVKKTLGYNVNEAIKLSLYEILLPPSKTDVQKEMNLLKDNHPPRFAKHYIPIYLQHKEKRTIILEVMYKYFNNHFGVPLVFGMARVKESLQEHNFRRALKDAGYVWYQTNEAGITTDAEKAESELYGRETIGLDRSELYLFPEDRKAFKAILKRNNNKDNCGEIRVLMKRIVDLENKEHEPIIVQTSSYFPLKKEEYGIHGIQKDITPLLNQYPDGIAVVRNGIIEFCNDKLGKIFGKPKSFILGSEFVLFFKQDDKKLILDTLSEPLDQEDKVINATVTSRKLDLGYFPHLEMKFETFEACIARCCFVTCRDVTAQHTYQNLVDQSQEGIYTIEGEKFIFTNKRMREIAGSPLEYDMKGEKWMDIVHPDDRMKIKQMHDEFKNSDKSIDFAHYDFRIQKKCGGNIFVETVVRRRKNDDNSIQSQGFLREITSRVVIRTIHQHVNDIPMMLCKYLEGINIVLSSPCSMVYFIDNKKVPKYFVFRNCVPHDFFPISTDWPIKLPIKGAFVKHLTELNRGHFVTLSINEMDEIFGKNISFSFHEPELKVQDLEFTLIPIFNSSDNRQQLIGITCTILNKNQVSKLNKVEEINQQLELALDNAIAYRKTSIYESITKTNTEQAEAVSVDQISRSIIQSIKTHLRVDQVSVYYLDSDENFRLSQTTSPNKQPEKGVIFPHNEGSVGKIASGKKIVVLNTSSGIDRLFKYKKEWKEIPLESIFSFIGVPILDRNRQKCLSVLLAFNKHSQFDDSLYVPFCFLDIAFFEYMQEVTFLLFSVQRYTQEKREETQVIMHETLAPAASIKNSIDTLRSFLPNQPEDDDENTVEISVPALIIIKRLSNNILEEAENLLGVENLIDTLLSQNLFLENNNVNVLSEIVLYCLYRSKAKLKKFGLNVIRKIEVNSSTDIPNYCLDKNKMRQVLYNLFDNSRKYIPKDIQREPIIKINLSVESNGDLKIDFSDYGPGIDPSISKEIFKKGYRGKDSEIFARGTGHGLAICRYIVEAHDGTILVTSHKDPFTITITLPGARKAI